MSLGFKRLLNGAWGSVVVKALPYKSEGPEIDSRCRRGVFPWHLTVPCALGSIQPLKMSRIECQEPYIVELQFPPDWHTKQSHRLIIPDYVLIQFDLLMMSAVTFETCRDMK